MEVSKNPSLSTAIHQLLNVGAGLALISNRPPTFAFQDPENALADYREQEDEASPLRGTPLSRSSVVWFSVFTLAFMFKGKTSSPISFLKALYHYFLLTTRRD